MPETSITNIRHADVPTRQIIRKRPRSTGSGTSVDEAFVISKEFRAWAEDCGVWTNLAMYTVG